MVKQIVIALIAATVSIASAATYTIGLLQPAAVGSENLKAGDYQLSVKDNSVVIGKGKKQMELPAKIENGQEKFDRTQVIFGESNGKMVIQEIHLGGTTTKVTFAK